MPPISDEHSGYVFTKCSICISLGLQLSVSGQKSAAGALCLSVPRVSDTIIGSGFGQKFRDMTRKKKSTGITGTRPGDPLRPIPVGSGSLMALLAPQTRSPGMWVPLHHHGSQAARPPEFFGTGPSGRPSRMTHGPARPPNYIQRVVPWVVLAVGWPW